MTHAVGRLQVAQTQPPRPLDVRQIQGDGPRWGQLRPHATAEQSFATLLRWHRTRAGLTQEELAERAGLSRRGIADLERGARRAPYTHTVERLAAALGLSATERAALTEARLGLGSATARPTAPQPTGRPQLRVLSTSAGSAEAGAGPSQAGPLAHPGPLMGHESEAAEPLDAALTPAAYADALDLLGGGSGPLLEGIIGLLLRRGLMLVLDDIEHILASAPAVSVILQAYPVPARHDQVATAPCCSQHSSCGRCRSGADNVAERAIMD